MGGRQAPGKSIQIRDHAFARISPRPRAFPPGVGPDEKLAWRIFLECPALYGTPHYAGEGAAGQPPWPRWMAKPQLITCRDSGNYQPLSAPHRFAVISSGLQNDDNNFAVRCVAEWRILAPCCIPTSGSDASSLQDARLNSSFSARISL